MGNKIVQVPGVGNVSFPDTMSDDDISAAISANAGSSSVPGQLKQVMAQSLARNSQPTQFERDNGTALPQVAADVARAQGYRNLQPTDFERQQSNWNPFGDLSGTQNDVGRAKNPGQFAAMQQIRKAAAAQLTSPENLANMAGEAIYPGLGQAGTGVVNVAKGNYAKGAHQIISGGLDAASTGLPFATAAAPLKVAAGLVAGAGGSSAGNAIAKSAGATPDQAALAGDVTGLVAGGLAAGAAPGERPPLAKEAAVDQITNAVNPAPEDMPKFRADLGQHLDSILQTAKQQGIPADSMSGLAKAINATSDNAHDLYMNQMVKPIANDVISVPDSVNVGNSKVTLTASVGDIVGRLKEINDTLSPKYNKAGLAGQAAIGAEQAAPLRAEAATLRSTLNDYMAKKLDLPVEQVAAARQNMGSLRQLGEDVQYYSDKSLNQANAASNAPITLETTATGMAGRGAQAVARKLRGLPSDRKVAGAVNNYRAQAVPRPVITMMEKTQAPSYQPSWMTPGTDSSLSVSGNFPTNDTGTPPDFNERYF